MTQLSFFVIDHLLVMLIVIGHHRILLAMEKTCPESNFMRYKRKHDLSLKIQRLHFFPDVPKNDSCRLMSSRSVRCFFPDYRLSLLFLPRLQATPILHVNDSTKDLNVPRSNNPYKNARCEVMVHKLFISSAYDTFDRILSSFF